MTEPDPLLNELKDLPARDAGADVAEGVRRAAVDALVEARDREAHPWRALFARAGRALTPILLAGTVGVYLSWAVSAANALFP